MGLILDRILQDPNSSPPVSEDDEAARKAKADAKRMKMALSPYSSVGDTFTIKDSTDRVRTILGGDRTTAIRNAAVWRCISVIAGALSQLEWRVSGKPKAEAENLYRLFNMEPTPLCGAVVWKQWIVQSILITGTQANWIRRGVNGGVLEIVPAIGISQILTVKGRRVYDLTLPGDGYGTTRQQRADQDDVLHFTGMGHSPFTGRSQGLVRDVLRPAIALHEAQEEYSHEFFSQPSFVRSVLFTDYDMTDEEQLDLMHEEWWRVSRSKETKAGAPMVFSKNITDIKELPLNFKEMQLKEGRDQQTGEILRAFGMPGLLANYAETGSWGPGMSEKVNGLVRFTFMHYVAGFENEVNRKMGPFVIDINTAGFTRATEKERYETHQKALGGGSNPGWKSINEIRAEEGLEPLPGDEYNVPYSGREPQRSKDESPALSNPSVDGDEGNGESKESGIGEEENDET